MELTFLEFLVKENNAQDQKAARVPGCLNDLVWRNKYMRKETKSKIHKAMLYLIHCSNNNIVSCAIWLWSMVFYIKGGMQAKGC